MKPTQIAVIVGSIRRDSINKKLAQAIEKLAPPEVSFKYLRIDDLPLYNQDDDAHQADSVLRLKKEIQEADALLFVTPEYNRSIPGVLKNALDHASRPYGKNAWAGKPGAVIGISPGATGTALSQQHLRNVLSYLDVPLLTQPEIYIQDKPGLYNDKGEIGEQSKAFLQSWMDAFIRWVEKLRD